MTFELKTRVNMFFNLHIVDILLYESRNLRRILKAFYYMNYNSIL
jgi:hypothetical protein